MIKFLIHACEQVLRFTQVEKWDDLSEQIKVQLGFNMGAVALALNLSKEDGFLVLSNAREGKISMQEFQEHMKKLVESYKIPVDPVQIARKF
jgi:hypothetical protein